VKTSLIVAECAMELFPRQLSGISQKSFFARLETEQDTQLMMPGSVSKEIYRKTDEIFHILACCGVNILGSGAFARDVGLCCGVNLLGSGAFAQRGPYVC
jgi:hypothetical protein